MHVKGIYDFKSHTRLYQIAKSEKYETFCLQLLIWRQKWVAAVWHGNSLVVCRVSPSRIMAVLFWTRYTVPRQIKARFLKLTNSRGQSNLCTVFVFVISCEEKGYYRVLSVRQLSFDCRSYCGRSRRMKGRYHQIKCYCKCSKKENNTVDTCCLLPVTDCCKVTCVCWSVGGVSILDIFWRQEWINNSLFLDSI